MKKYIIAAASCLIVSTSAVCAAENKGKIMVDIAGLKNNAGVVRVALFNTEDSYKADKENDGATAFQKKIAQIKDQQAACEFTEVPYGTYVIKFFHDEDNSGKFKTGLVGIPKVEYGFSNNAKALFGPPSFDKAKFSLQSQELKMQIGSQSKPQ